MNTWMLEHESVGALVTSSTAALASLLLQSTVLGAAGLLAARAVRRRGAAAESAVLRAALAAMLLSPLLSLLLKTSGAPGLSLRLPAHRDLRPAEAVARRSDLPSIGAVTPAQATAPSGPRADGVPTAAPGQPGQSSPPGRREKVPAAGVAQPEPEPVRTAGLFFASLYAISVGGWLLAAAALLTRLLLAYLVLLRARKRGIPAPPAAQELCRSLAGELRTVGPALLVSPGVRSPCLTGLLHPTILLPEGSDDSQAGLTLREVLLHELAHLRNRDCLWNLLSRLSCALIPFQPMAWRLAERVEEVSDERADDWVIQHSADRSAYARGLTETAERLLSRPIELLAGLGVAPLRSTLAQRIKRILDTSRRLTLRISRAGQAAVAAGGLIAISLVSLISVSAGAGSSPEAPPAGPSQPARVVAVPAPPSETAARGHTGRIVGTVVDAVTGAPVSGAYVGTGDFGDSGGANYERHRAEGFFDSTKTDQRGAFELKGLVTTEGHPYLAAHQVLVTHSNYVPGQRLVSLPRGAIPEVRIALDLAARLLVRVADAEGRLATGYYSVRLTALDGHRFIPAGRDRHLGSFASSSWILPALNGTVTCGELRPGDYAVEAVQVAFPSSRTRVAGYAGFLSAPAGTRYHGAIASLRLDADKTTGVDVRPQSHGTRLTIELPGVPAEVQRNWGPVGPLAFVSLSRNTGLLLWTSAAPMSPEDDRLGRMQKESFFWGALAEGRTLTIENLPPGDYSVLGGPPVFLTGRVFTLNPNEEKMVRLQWREPKEPRRIRLWGMGRSLKLPSGPQTVAELLEQLTKATEGHPQFAAAPAIAQTKLSLRPGQWWVWDLLEELHRSKGWRLEQTGVEDTFVLGPPEA
jgi:beta-lactamase regulating signal transducer with metallopeptidase domain